MGSSKTISPPTYFPKISLLFWLQARRKKAEREAKEAAKALGELNTDAAASGKGAGGKKKKGDSGSSKGAAAAAAAGAENDLALLIRRRSEERARGAAFLADLEARFAPDAGKGGAGGAKSGKRGGGKSGKGVKRPVEPSEEEFLAAQKRLLRK